MGMSIPLETVNARNPQNSTPVISFPTVTSRQVQTAGTDLVNLYQINIHYEKKQVYIDLFIKAI